MNHILDKLLSQTGSVAAGAPAATPTPLASSIAAIGQGGPALPPVPISADPTLAPLLRKMREVLMTLPDLSALPARSITQEALEQAGIDSSVLPGATPPPTPKGLRAEGALTSIILSWDMPPSGCQAEIWVAAADDLSQAVLLERTAAAITTHALGSNATRYYWLRYYRAGVTGSFQSQAGLKASTGTIDPILEQMRNNPGQITSEMIKALDAAKVAGTLQDWQLAGLQAGKLIGLLESAQIKALDATKLIGLINSVQIKSVDASQVMGQLESNQIKALDAFKLTGQISGAQVKNVVDGLNATMANNQAKNEQQLAVLADADKAIGLSVEGVSATVAANKAAVDRQITTLTTADAANAQEIGKLTARLAPAGDVGQSLAAANTKADQALVGLDGKASASSVQQLQAGIDKLGKDKANQTDVNAALSRLSTVETDLKGKAGAQDLTALRSTVGANQSAVEKQLKTLSEEGRAIG
ncbi:hypothetical protein CEK28_08430, partial [Xenophilus sp. AP218F]